MSKIICEICGTAYPETSTQCPICGYVRSAEVAAVSADDSTAGNSQYTYVKGGRFSKANVKKRNRAQQKAASSGATAAAANTNRQRDEKPKKGKKNIGFILISIILLLMILAAVVFLIFRFFLPELPESSPQQDTPTQQQSDPTDNVIACSGISLDVEEVKLTEAGEARMIYATATPANTTDTVEFKSSDESVVAVTQSGKITAVGPGEAKIIVTCGAFQAECKVVCDIQPETEPTTEPTEETTEPTEETTEPTEETTQEPTIVLEQSMFNRKDFTMLFKGEKWTLYVGEIDASLITWTSDNPNIAKIENGVVTAVGKGTTKVHAEYNGVTITCIVRCNF